MRRAGRYASPSAVPCATLRCLKSLKRCSDIRSACHGIVTQSLNGLQYHLQMYVKYPLTIAGPTPPTDVLMFTLTLSPVNYPICVHRSRYHFQQALATRGDDSNAGGTDAINNSTTGSPRSDGQRSSNLNQGEEPPAGIGPEAAPVTSETSAAPAPSHEDSAEKPTPEKPKRKLHSCPRPGCTKVYKQLSGLRYHLTHVRSYIVRVTFCLLDMFVCFSCLGPCGRATTPTGGRTADARPDGCGEGIWFRLCAAALDRLYWLVSHCQRTVAVGLVLETARRLRDCPTIGAVGSPRHGP